MPVSTYDTFVVMGGRYGVLSVGFYFLSILSCGAVETDLGVAGFLRGKSPAGILEGQAGASQVAWGDPGAGPMFGYIRASGSLRTSGLANGYRAQLDAYPVSFFGVSAGTQGLHRASDAPSVNCEGLDCRGWVRSRYLQVRGVFRFGEVFGQAYFQRDFFSDGGAGVPLFEPMTMLALDPLGDRVNSWNGVLGYQVNPEWALGGLYLGASSGVFNGKSENELLFARWKPSDVTYTFAVGRVSSSVVGVGPQALVMIAWWPKARVGY